MACTQARVGYNDFVDGRHPEPRRVGCAHRSS